MLQSALPSSQFWSPADLYQRAIKDNNNQAYHWEKATSLLHYGQKSSPDTEPDEVVLQHNDSVRQFKHTFLFIFVPFSVIILLVLAWENLTSFFIPRKPESSQSGEDWGPTPDALLLAPRATERFLRPVKPAGCAQGSKIQHIPGQLSGDSYFVNGQTHQIFEIGNYRLTKLIRDRACSFDE